MGLSGTSALTIVVGVALLTVGMMIQKKQRRGFWGTEYPYSEGFQAVTATTVPPPNTFVPPPAVLPTPPPMSTTVPQIPPAGSVLPPKVAAPPPPLPTGENDEKDELKRRVHEIRNMFKLINAIQPRIDGMFVLAMDHDVLEHLFSISEEVRFFLGESSSPEFSVFTTKLNDFDSLSPEQQDTVRSMIVVGFQYAQLLQYIYQSLPAMLISTNMLVDASTATTSSSLNPKVIKEVIGSATATLSSFPKLSEKLEESMKELMSATEAFSVDTVGTFMNIVIRYDRLTNQRLNALRRIQGLQNSTKVSLSNIKDPEIMNLVKSIDTTLTDKMMMETIQSKLKILQICKAKVDTVSKANPSNVEITQVKVYVDGVIQGTTLVNATTEMTNRMAASSVASPTTENFVSAGNPYNSQSPNLTQAYNFRLGKRGLVNEVSSTSLIR